MTVDGTNTSVQSAFVLRIIPTCQEPNGCQWEATNSLGHEQNIKNEISWIVVHRFICRLSEKLEENGYRSLARSDLLGKNNNNHLEWQR
jgi:hypothetical protein